MGSMLPRMESNTAWGQGIPSTAIATGMAPRSSTMGSIEMRITMSQGWMPLSLRLWAVRSPKDVAQSWPAQSSRANASSRALIPIFKFTPEILY